MAILTIGSNVSIDAMQPTFGITVTAVEAISAGMACTLDADGKAKKAINTDVFVGFALKDAAAGKPVTLYRMAKIVEYSSSMAEATNLYMAGAGNEGKLSDAPIVATDPAVALIVSTTDIIIR
jgi:hypothetical protein